MNQDDILEPGGSDTDWPFLASSARRLATCFAMYSLLLLGCGGDHDDPPPPNASPVAKVATKPAPSPPSPPQPGRKRLPRCDKLVPAAVRTKHFAAYTVTDAPDELYCAMRDPKTGEMAALMELDCSDSMMNAMVNTVAVMKKDGGEEVSGIGRAAVRASKSIKFWDDDTNCVVAVEASNPVGVARELAVALTPSSLSRGCELIPASTRDKYFSGYVVSHEFPYSATCTLESPKQPAVELDFICIDGGGSMASTIDMMKKSDPKATDLTGIGRGGLKMSTGAVMFWDDDTNCAVTFGIPASRGAPSSTAVAKDLAAALTPEIFK